MAKCPVADQRLLVSREKPIEEIADVRDGGTFATPVATATATRARVSTNRFLMTAIIDL